MATDTANGVSGFRGIAILSMFLMTGAASLLTPALETFSVHWPDQNVNLMATIPTLFIVFGTLISGFLANRMKYRTIALIGGLLFLIGGCAPYFFDDFWMTLACRAVFGLGNGFLVPIGTALVVGLYDGQKQAKMLGYGTLALNLGAIILQTLGGFLAEIDYRLVFLGHLFVLIAIVMAFFLPEPRYEETQTGKKEKFVYPKGVIIAGLLMCIFCILDFAVMMNVSYLFVERGAGDAMMAGMALNFYTIMGCVAGLVYGYVFTRIPRWTMPLAYALTALGPALIYFGDSFAVMILGLGCTGFGFAFMTPLFLSWVGLVTDPKHVAVCTAFVMAMMNIGNFLSTFWMEGLQAVFGETLYSVVYMELIIQAIFTVVFIIYDPLRIKQRKEAGETIEA